MPKSKVTFARRPTHCQNSKYYQTSYKSLVSKHTAATTFVTMLLFFLLIASQTTEPTETMDQQHQKCPTPCRCNNAIKQVSCHLGTGLVSSIPADTKTLYATNMPFPLSKLLGLSKLQGLYLANSSITNIQRYYFQGE